MQFKKSLIPMFISFGTILSASSTHAQEPSKSIEPVQLDPDTIQTIDPQVLKATETGESVSVIMVADSTPKCNSPSRNRGQAAVAS